MTNVAFKACASCSSDKIHVSARVMWHAADQKWVADPFNGVTTQELENCECLECGHVGAPVDELEE